MSSAEQYHFPSAHQRNILFFFFQWPHMATSGPLAWTPPHKPYHMLDIKTTSSYNNTTKHLLPHSWHKFHLSQSIEDNTQQVTSQFFRTTNSINGPQLVFVYPPTGHEEPLRCPTALIGNPNLLISEQFTTKEWNCSHLSMSKFSNGEDCVGQKVYRSCQSKTQTRIQPNNTRILVKVV